MLSSEAVVLGEALDEIDDRIDELEKALAELNSDTDEAATVRSRRNRLQYFRNGLDWHAADPDDVDHDAAWGPETTIEVGALTAGEEAMMHREIRSEAGQKERRLWYVAAATESAPFVEDDLSDTFANVSGLHPAFVEWVEAKSNSLGVAGNRSSTSSTATEASKTSTPTPDSTT